MRAVLNTCSDFFMERNLTQFQLVLETQFYYSSIPLGTHQEEIGLVFGLTTKLKSLDFNITVLNFHSASGIY